MTTKSQNKPLNKQTTKVSEKKTKSGQKKGIKNSKYQEIIQKLESHENTPQAIAEDYNSKIITKKRSHSNPHGVVIKKGQPLPSSFSSTRAVFIKKEEASKVCSKLPFLDQDAENKIQVLSKPKPHLLQQEEKEIEELEESLDLLDYLSHSGTQYPFNNDNSIQHVQQQHYQQFLTPAATTLFDNSNTNRKTRGFTIGVIPKQEKMDSRLHFRQQSDNTASRTFKRDYLHVRSKTAQTLPHIIVQRDDITNDPFYFPPPPLRSRSRLSSSESTLDGTQLSWCSDDLQKYPYTQQRKDSGLSMSFDTKYEELYTLLSNEYAKVEQLKRDKQAILEEMYSSNQIVDKLTKENTELKKKYELEKINHKKCQEDLLISTEKLNKCIKKIRKPEIHPLKIETDSNHLLKKQLESTQVQVRLLKSTMREFLRMGIFNEQLLSPSVFTPTDQTLTKMPKDTDENLKLENEAKEDLDIKLNQLLVQKEIVHSEYNRLPSFNNALTRKQRDEYERRLDQFDSQIYSLKFRMRSQMVTNCT